MVGDDELTLWKREQRNLLIEQRSSLTEIQRVNLEQKIIGHLKQVLSFHKPSVLSLYWPIKGEVDCRPLCDELISRGWKLTVPVINTEKKILEFAHWTPHTEMIAGLWGIPIPRQIEWYQPDVLLIPLVGFDCHNYRLGYGGGYYDRTLATDGYLKTKIGIGLEMGRLTSIQPHQYDIQMDVIVTEKESYYLSSDS